MENKFNDRDFLIRINKFKEMLYEFIEIYENQGKDLEKLGKSFDDVDKDFEKIAIDFEDHYLEPIIWTCPCLDKSFTMRHFIHQYSQYSEIWKKNHDAYLLCGMARNRIQALCGKYDFSEREKSVLITDEPRIHIENILQRVNETIIKK